VQSVGSDDRKRAGRWLGKQTAFLVCGFCAWSIGRWVVINVPENQLQAAKPGQETLAETLETHKAHKKQKAARF